jgi:probable F420-dependent oxidoreductase
VVTDAAFRYGISPPNWGAFGDPRAAAELGRIAEDAGWDGYLTWDAVFVTEDPPPCHDPWVILGAVASATERIRIGTCIAPLPRYQPHVVARTLASLDVLSGGRLILGVGIGDGGGSFEAFGEPGEARVRAAKLDEALEVITRLWSGEQVTHHGTHYRIDGFTLSALPLQRPRIPIWVGGDSPPARRRAARWDGWIGPDEDPLGASPEHVPAVREELQRAGASFPSFDLAWAGTTVAGDHRSAAAAREAGATWWIEIAAGDREQVLTRVAAGPPSA